jgi:hypothetical protein
MPGTVTAEQIAQRMRDIAAQLSAAGLDTRLHESRASIDVTASTRGPVRDAVEVCVDEDGYTELRYWHPADATPAQVCDVITRAIATITAAGPASEPPPAS